MAKTGRPSVFNKQMREMAVRLAGEPGMTMRKLASLLGVGKSTLFLYLQKDKDFLDHLHQALTMADDLVEISMFRRAIGYTHAEEKIFCTPTGEIRRAQTIKHYPPSETAGMYWLNNRQPDRWKKDGMSGEQDDEKPIKIAIDEQGL